jgi:hypothetical protein
MTTTAVEPDSASYGDQQLTALRRSLLRFHGRLAETLPIVLELERGEWSFQRISVATTIDVTMVSVELAIGALSGPDVSITLFGGQAIRSDREETSESSQETAGMDRRQAWEQVWTLRYSATQFGSKINHALFHHSDGLTRSQYRVLAAAVAAITRLVELIGGLPVPSEFLELVR